MGPHQWGLGLSQILPFRIGCPICTGTTLCLAQILCMSAGTSQMCHIPHNNHICVACGQVLAKHALPRLSTRFMNNHVCSIGSAMHFLSTQMCWTYPNQAPAPSTLRCQIAFVLDCWHPSIAPTSPSSTARTHGMSLCPRMMLHSDVVHFSCFKIP
jgi:hypothetical protein